jgi:hypothetical protein
MIEALNFVGVVEPCLAPHRRGRGYMGQRPLTKHSMANKCCRTLFISIEECQGPIPRVPRAISYDLINMYIVQFPPAAKWLGNQVRHTRATPSLMGHVSVPFYLGSHTPGTLGSITLRASDHAQTIQKPELLGNMVI